MKYGYKDMWHWAELLNRFARSSGNTIGIIQASVDWNVAWPGAETVFPLDSLQAATEDEYFPGPDYNTVRDTINLETLELQRTVDALPYLLGQLNIPVDAVGKIHRRDKSPVGPGIPAVQSEQQVSGLAIVSAEPSHTGRDGVPPPPGDCWGGALSDDPLHCYVLEQAQSEGIIDVDAVYWKGPEYVFRGFLRLGGELRFYLKRTDPVGEDVLRYIERTAQVEVLRSGGYECVLQSDGCETGVFWKPGHRRRYILPVTEGTQEIVLIPGGAEARRTEPGWASYTQMWPATGRATGDDGEDEPVGFDMSDVDTTNFDYTQEVCRTHSCDMAMRYSSLDIAGWHYIGDKAWIQVKVHPGEDEEVRVASVREELYRIKGRGRELVIIPVRYSYKELWHWNELLDRFALSAGNTIGIVRSEIYTNHYVDYDGSVYKHDSLVERVPSDRSTLRETLHLWTLDFQRTMDSLPQLLGQLHIPVDAVGVVAQFVQLPPNALVRKLVLAHSPAESQTASLTPGGLAQGGTVPPPPGDCWGGALSDDPLHCYALEKAQREGLIEVEGVYDAFGELRIFLNFLTGPTVPDLELQRRYEELDDTLTSNGREFATRFPERVTYNLPIAVCRTLDLECALDRTFETELLVPWDSPYISIVLHPGDADARRKIPGWASWRQIWPATESGPSGTSDGFDISDVDVTTLPAETEMECSKHYGDFACRWAKVVFPGFGIAGSHRVEKDYYIQVKAAPGEAGPFQSLR